MNPEPSAVPYAPQLHPEHQPAWPVPTGPPQPIHKGSAAPVLIVLLSIVLVGCLSAVAYFALRGGDSGNHIPVGGIGFDGSFGFTVTHVEYDDDSIIDGRVAQGRYCLVSLTIENIGDRPHTFSPDVQKAHRSDGSTDAADTAIGFQSETSSTSLNPHTKIAGTLVFDIPRSAKLVDIELHDSAFSRGVYVDVA
jgi:hypothetical protein